MVDEIDKAVEREEFITSKLRTIKRVRQCDLAQFFDWDRETCYDCGIDMPSQRIADGRVRCVDCQEEAEKDGRT